MGHSLVGGPPGLPSSLRTVRPGGTLVYRYRQRPGLPPVSVTRFDTDAAHAALPPDHRHAHDFFVLLYVEQGAGSVTVDGAERSLRTGDLHVVSPGQTVGVGAATEIARGRAWSVAFTPDAVPALTSVSPLAWMHHPLLALFAADGPPVRIAGPDRANWSAWLADLAEELADPARLGTHEAVAALLTRLLVAAARLAPSARPRRTRSSSGSSRRSKRRSAGRSPPPMSPAHSATPLGISRPCSAGAPAAPCSNGSPSGA
ncbi:AraC family ligand binding domain-containing protein [Paractinoplanes durhamensis]|uniref:AraC family ligand binding domain-containing protein n=1 Tax=Paractinoplanes durhamensis TaxID=113563 RepID=UPI003630A1FF